MRGFGFSKKRLLKRAAEPLVPSEIIRGAKRGFSIPLAAWLRNELQPLTREVLSATNLRSQGYLDPVAAGRLVDDHIAGRADEGRKIWALLNFCLWFDRFAAAAESRA